MSIKITVNYKHDWKSNHYVKKSVKLFLKETKQSVSTNDLCFMRLNSSLNINYEVIV